MARAIPNVHDQPESFRYRWPTVMNLIRPVKFQTVSQTRILDAWHTWRDAGRIFVTQNFSAIFGRMFDRVPVWILTFTIELHEKKILQDQRIWLWSAVWSDCNCVIRELSCITSFCLFYTLSFLSVHAWPKIMFSLWVVSDLWIRCRTDHLPLVCNCL